MRVLSVKPSSGKKTDLPNEPPLGVAQRVLAQFGQLLLPVFGPPKAAANWRMAHALEIFVGRDGARVAVTILAAGQCLGIG